MSSAYECSSVLIGGSGMSEVYMLNSVGRELLPVVLLFSGSVVLRLCCCTVCRLFCLLGNWLSVL